MNSSEEMEMLKRFLEWRSDCPNLSIEAVGIFASIDYTLEQEADQEQAMTVK